MTRVVSTSKAMENIFNLIDETATTHQPILITGKRNNVVMINKMDWSAIQETFYLSSNPAVKASIIKDDDDTKFTEANAKAYEDIIVVRPHYLILPSEHSFYKAVGCEKCANTGYFGREMITEVLNVSDDMASAIASGASKHAIEEIAKESGFETMLVDGVRRAALGVTTLDEVYRVARL